MMLNLPRRRGHLLRSPLKLEIHPLLFIRPIRVGHFQPCVGRDDGQLTEVLHDARFVGGPISGDEDLDFGSYPLFGVGFLRVLDDSGLIFVNVDIQNTSTNNLSHLSSSDNFIIFTHIILFLFVVIVIVTITLALLLPLVRIGRHMTGLNPDRHPGTLLTPNQSHLGPQSEFPPRLPHSVFGTRQDPPQQVRYGIVGHAASVVADGEEEVGIFFVVAFGVCGVGRRLSFGGIAFGFSVILIFHVLVIFLVISAIVVFHLFSFLPHGTAAATIATPPVGNAPHPIKLPLRHLLDDHVDIGQNIDRFARIEGIFDQFAQGRVEGFARVVEAGDGLIFGEEFGGRFGLLDFVFLMASGWFGSFAGVVGGVGGGGRGRGRGRGAFSRDGHDARNFGEG
mmetsp:Transcript_24640/g.49303  ORF Transcript_24640/g.49303 Transcript_24640/m.49303 type:complete len:394 (-) Transcript_24640:14-1195(-)